MKTERNQSISVTKQDHCSAQKIHVRPEGLDTLSNESWEPSQLLRPLQPQKFRELREERLKANYTQAATDHSIPTDAPKCPCFFLAS